MFADGTIPKGAITWQEEQGRQAFQDGELIFHRNWPYVYALAQKTDGSSKVAGKFDVAPLPGVAGPGVSSLGGHNFAIAANAENKGTAADFMEDDRFPEVGQCVHKVLLHPEQDGRLWQQNHCGIYRLDPQG